jgi:hypothetical protein
VKSAVISSTSMMNNAHDEKISFSEESGAAQVVQHSTFQCVNSSVH